MGRRERATPFEQDVADSRHEHDHEQPAEWLNCPSSWFHLGLLGNVKPLGLLLGKEELLTAGTIHASMAAHDEEIPLRQNPSLLGEELIATAWTSEVASLPFAERAGRISTPRDFKILESRPSPVREDMPLAYPF